MTYITHVITYHHTQSPYRTAIILHLCFMSTAKPRSLFKPSLGRNLSCWNDLCCKQVHEFQIWIENTYQKLHQLQVLVDLMFLNSLSASMFWYLHVSHSSLGHMCRKQARTASCAIIAITRERLWFHQRTVLLGRWCKHARRTILSKNMWTYVKIN